MCMYVLFYFAGLNKVLHILNNNMIFLILILVYMSLITGNTNHTPQCLENAIRKEEVICKDVENTKELYSVVKNTWRFLKIINDKAAQFVWNDISDKFLNLEYLDLSQAGELVLQDTGFKNVPNLKSLNVSTCDVISLEGGYFSPSNKLINLDASWNSLLNLSSDLQNKLQTLEVGNFSHNEIKQVASDGLLPNLKILHLDNNELSSIKLHKYRNLEILTLSDNQIKSLSSNSFISLNSMEELIFTSGPLRHIDDRAFESMIGLKTLNLSANNLEQLSPEVFAGLGYLLRLDLNSNDLKKLANLQFNYLVKLQYLDISRNSLKSLSSSHFNGLTNLRKLYIYDNDIRDISSNTFANLAALDTLDLSYNSLEYLNADIFGSDTLHRLRKLILKSNSLKNLHPLAFSSLPFLQYLSLGNNELETLDVRMFAPLRRLEKLHLGNNLLETISPDVLEAFNDISELLLDNNRLSFLPNSNVTFPNMKKVSLEGNPWECPCWDEMTQWLEDRNVSYVRAHSPYFKGQKPLCVVIPVDFCVKDIKLVREHKIEEIFRSG